ncbi:lectin-like domain-containing protein [Enterococcus faecalis]|uniref:lectin-like domain-containing protein n=2 Tax=Enterococcus faecalis TaxID=1351 RepID=UPI0015E2C925|nr:MucBP domain-containing protein [Enterococcus faecalis]
MLLGVTLGITIFFSNSYFAEGPLHSVIKGDDYANNFTPNGSAVINSNTATLTPDQSHLAGNTILNTKIDMRYSFKLNGEVNLGDKSKAQGGADGISFVFQPGDTNVIGIPGGSMAIGGIQGAFGFKLDTYYNQYGQAAFMPDPSEFATSDNGNPSAFGAFVDGIDGVAKTIEATAQSITQPSQNMFKPISISYDGTSKIMTISYDGKIWTQNVSALIGQNESMSFAITAGTGDSKNLQEFKLNDFEYIVAEGKVIAKYIDEQGNVIAQEETYKGDLDKEWQTVQKDIPGYKFKELVGTDKGKFEVNDQEVIYIYTKTDTETTDTSTTDTETTDTSTTDTETTDTSTTDTETTDTSTTDTETTDTSTTDTETTDTSTTDTSTTDTETTDTSTTTETTESSKKNIFIGSNDNNKNLPKTGEKKSLLLIVLGGLILLISSWIYFRNKKSA